MSANYIVNKVFYENGNICFQLRNNESIEKIQARYYPEKTKYLPVRSTFICKTFDTFTGDEYSYIPIEKFFSELKCCSSENLVSLYALSSQNEAYNLQSTIKSETICDEKDFTITAKTNNYKQLQFELILKPQITCKEIFLTQNSALFDIEENNYDIKIGFKKRYDINAQSGDFLAVFPLNFSPSLEISLSLFEISNLTYACDVYAMIMLPDLNIEYIVPLRYNSQNFITTYKQQNIKFYKNMHGNLSIYVTTIIQEKLVSVSEENNILSIEKVNNLMLFDEKKKFFQEIEYENLNRIFQNNLINTFTLYEKADHQLFKLKPDKNCSFVINGENRDFLISGTPKSELSFRIKTKSVPIKIATWASCYVRLAFKNDINLNWRDYFEVVSSYFQPSLFSITSEPIKLLNQKDLIINDNEEHEKNVKRTFEKTSFKELSESNAQYLLIDFYADALGYAQRFEDGTFIDALVSLFPSHTQEHIALYKEKVQTISTPVDYYYDDYLAEWKAKCDKFCDLLYEYNYSDKVILLKGYFNVNFISYTDKVFYNLNNKTLENGKTINYYYLVEKKYIWDEMNNYFLSKLPNTKIIDLSNYNFFADYNNAFLGPHHFEKNFYRAYFAELCKKILF